MVGGPIVFVKGLYTYGNISVLKYLCHTSSRGTYGNISVLQNLEIAVINNFDHICSINSKHLMYRYNTKFT